MRSLEISLQIHRKTANNLKGRAISINIFIWILGKFQGPKKQESLLFWLQKICMMLRCLSYHKIKKAYSNERRKLYSLDQMTEGPFLVAGFEVVGYNSETVYGRHRFNEESIETQPIMLHNV